MRRLAGRSAIGGLAAAGLVAVGGAAYAASASGAGSHSGLTAGQVLAAQGPRPVRVIVLLRNQYSNLPPSSRFIGARERNEAASQAPLHAAVTATGGRVLHAYSAVNAFAATVSQAESERLAANPAVAAVAPDALVHEDDASAGGEASPATNGSKTTTPTISTSVTGSATAVAGACPTNPAKPLLQPEGLSLVHAPQANQLATGKGVTVAFVADGVDPDNPDFIRPDGSHVFVDYRDFSGDGPFAPTLGGEAFGDASSIAGQGDVVYDLSRFVNPAHPLPPGCNITIQGVAPGASLVGMKVFPNSNFAFTSTILQGMDWAVAVDHVDVLNESFGSLPLPDTTQDVIKEFNDQATSSGVVVTAASGDQGTASTIGSPASDPDVLSVGATTQFQHFAQTTRGAFQFATDGWLNDNIAEFSSAGFTQEGGTLDLAAPGNESWEPCDASPTYSDCVNYSGQPSDISTFGGTSESSPFTAGAAADVIQAYRDTHGGASPSPSLVKSLILSNTDDLDIPSDEQGAGELNVLRAVQAARSVATSGSHPAPIGDGLLISPNQLDLQSQPGGTSTATVTVTNVGASAQSLTAGVRVLSQQLSDLKGSATLDATGGPTFIDNKGIPQAFTEIHFKVPGGADRLDASIAWPGPTDTVNLTLIDPQGRYAAYTYQSVPTGGSDFHHISVRVPTAGTWTGVFFTPAGQDGFSGQVLYDLSSSRFTSTGAVSPSSGTLAPGASATVKVALPAPSGPGDYNRDLVVGSGDGRSTVVPVVQRVLVPTGPTPGAFTGTLTGGNGNPPGGIAQEKTFAFDVPAGEPNVAVNVKVPNNLGTTLIAFLVAPDGQNQGDAVGQPVSSTSPNQTIQIIARAPAAGQWRLVIVSLNPVGGTTLSSTFTGTVTLNAATVSSQGVPSGGVIKGGQSVTATVTVKNTTVGPLALFADPRESSSTLYSLVPLGNVTDFAIPISPTETPPEWFVPNETSELFAAVTASEPVFFDWGFGDPDLGSTPSGDSAFSEFSAPSVAPGVWFLTPAPIGPFTSANSGTATAGLAALARTFDPNVTSSTGNVNLPDVDPNAPAPAPLVIGPGQTGTITLTFTGSGHPGTKVSGDVFVDDGLGAPNEIAAIPYAYKIAGPH